MKIKHEIPMPKRRMVDRRRVAITPAIPEPPPGPVKVFLTVCHSVNGVRYGPGAVEVPADLAPMILENEQRNLAEERGLSQRRAHMIAPGGRKIAVAPEAFDDPAGMMGMPAQFAVQGGDRR